MPTWSRLIVALACMAAALGCRKSEAPDSRGPQLALANQKQPFYEDNPTYISAASVAWPTSAPEAQGVDATLLFAADAELAATASTLSFLLIRNGSLVHEAYFHGSEAHNSHNIHSASKGILGALVGILVEQGALNLGDKITELLPNYIYRGNSKAGMTLEHLLTMSAGFRWTEDKTEATIERADDWVQAIIDLPLARAPGQRFNYSTGQTHLVSAIVARASGSTTSDFAERALFAPLGITFEHWGHDPKGVASGGYNLYMTPRALARFALLCANRGTLDGQRIISSDWVDASRRAHMRVDNDYSYGYYWWRRTIGGHLVEFLWGFGGQFAYLIPDFNAIVVLSNDTHNDHDEMDGEDFLKRFVIPALSE